MENNHSMDFKELGKSQTITGSKKRLCSGFAGADRSSGGD